jgi:mannonate dehydratase
MSLPDAGPAPLAPAPRARQRGAAVRGTAGGGLVPPGTPGHDPGHGFGSDEAAARRNPVPEPRTGTPYRNPVPEPPARDRRALPRNTDGSVQRP